MQSKFTIPGIPQSKRKMSISRSGIMFTPKRVKDAELDFISLAREYLPDKINSEHPVSLIVTFYFPIPTSYPKWKKEMMQDEKWPHTKVPDCDNILKLVMDSMTKLGFWKDDRYVYGTDVSKFYSDNPRTEVEVSYLPITTRTGLILF